MKLGVKRGKKYTIHYESKIIIIKNKYYYKDIGAII